MQASKPSAKECVRRSGVRALSLLLLLSLIPPPLVAADGNSLIVDDFHQAAPHNLLGGEMGVVANGGLAGLDFPRPPLAHLTNASMARVSYELDGTPGYAFFWMKLGPKGESEGASRYLDLRDYAYLSFKYKAEKKTDFKIEVHEDLNKDGRYTFGQDGSSPIYLSFTGAKTFELEDGWRKAVIALPRFKGIKDWSKTIELVFVFEKDRSGASGEIFFEDILFGKLPLDFKKAGQEKHFFQNAAAQVNGQPVRPESRLAGENRFEVRYQPGEDFGLLESLAIELKPEGSETWHEVANTYEIGADSSVLNWEVHAFTPPAFALRIVARDLAGGAQAIAGPFEKMTLPAMTDEEFLDLAEHRAFLYFYENQNADSGLFLDTSGGGDASIAVSGFGLTALVIGAERGWIAKDEAARRVERCLDTLLQQAEKQDGFYYHFLNPQTAERVGTSEVSTVDTVLLLAGAITAGEYFGGTVKTKADRIYADINWPAFLNQEEDREGYMNFHHGWTPEEGLTDYYWDFFTDETMLITLLAIGSPTHPVSPETFYRFVRRKGRYGNGEEFIFSWHGALFSYQYAHPWYNFRGIVDREGVNWVDNAKAATLANRQFVMDNAQQYQTYGPDSWGITSMRIPDKYVMHYGILPNGQNKTEHDVTIAPSGPGGSIIFTPYLSLRVLKHLYQRYPQIWGRYGFKDSINLDRNWVSPVYYGLGEGIFLIGLENFRTGLVWDIFMKNQPVQKSLERAEFKKQPSPAPEERPDLEKIRQTLTGAGLSNAGTLTITDTLSKIDTLEDLERLYGLVAENGQAVERPGNRVQAHSLLAKIRMRMLEILEGNDLELGRHYLKDGPVYVQDALSHLKAAFEAASDVQQKADVASLKINLLEQVQDERGWDAALDELRQVLEKALNAGQIDLGTALGLAAAAGDEGAARLRFRLAEKLGPEPLAVMLSNIFTRAEAELKARNYRKAAGLYREHLELMTRTGAKQDVYGFIEKVTKSFISAEQFGQAEWFYREFLKQGGITPEAEEETYYQLAQILVWKGDKAGAIRAYRLFTEKFRSSPRVPKAFMNIANLESALGNKPVAIQVLRRVVNQYPASPEAEEALYLIGMIYYHTGAYTKAVVVWEDFQKQYPASKFNRTVTDYLERAQAKLAQSKRA